MLAAFLAVMHHSIGWLSWRWISVDAAGCFPVAVGCRGWLS